MSGLPASGAVDSQAIPLAVDIGWTMAVLFGQLRPGSVRDRLPTEHELPPDQRAQLEVAFIRHRARVHLTPGEWASMIDYLATRSGE